MSISMRAALCDPYCRLRLAAIGLLSLVALELTWMGINYGPGIGVEYVPLTAFLAAHFPFVVVALVNLTVVATTALVALALGRSRRIGGIEGVRLILGALVIFHVLDVGVDLGTFGSWVHAHGLF